MSEELKPCPFCGKSVATLSNTDELSGRPDISFMHTVVCNANKGGCGTAVGYEVDQSDAIANWNRRALSARASAGEGGEWAKGVKACIAWVEKRRHDFESEYGMVDPSTGAMEFRSVAKEEYDAELGEIEEGLRAMLAAAPQPQGDAATWEEEIRRHDAIPQPAAVQGIISEMRDFVDETSCEIGCDAHVKKWADDLAASTQPRHWVSFDAGGTLAEWSQQDDIVTVRVSVQIIPPAHSEGEVKAAIADLKYIAACNPRMMLSIPIVLAELERLTTRPTPEAQEDKDD